ncbi:hopanoid-associated phosphorylase [Salinisphaera dokdonensis CL-ES53]|uniref:Hopanoid-associated phosphorylase n=1 Tax=Salinisphaera dokdonensis CL-ES53 TaxID=1304272 RepID=A0ABV2AZ89_9GAMM
MTTAVGLSLPTRARVTRPGIVATLPAEARALARLRLRGRALLAGGGQVALSGLGAARAEATARMLVAEGVNGLISWGSAAGLVPALAPGDLLLPHVVRGRDGVRYECSPDWLLEIAHASEGLRVRHGLLAESPGALIDLGAKHALQHASDAVASDMESVAIARVAADFDLPFIAIRAVADDATMILPPVIHAALDEDGALRPLPLLRALAGRPRSMHAQLRALKQLAVAFRAAQNSLARVAPYLRDAGLPD